MADRERRRRVVLLCCNFARNLAFYRVGQEERWRSLLSDTHRQAGFWRQTNANFLEICVLEWCKLLADKKAKHHWSRVVRDQTTFESAMLLHVGMTAAEFDNEIKDMLRYRDKFIAHLDNLPVMKIPMLDAAKAAVWFYHCHVVTSEAQSGDLTGIPADTPQNFNHGYEQSITEAGAIFSLYLETEASVQAS